MAGSAFFTPTSGTRRSTCRLLDLSADTLWGHLRFRVGTRHHDCRITFGLLHATPRRAGHPGELNAVAVSSTPLARAHWRRVSDVGLEFFQSKERTASARFDPAERPVREYRTGTGAQIMTAWSGKAPPSIPASRLQTLGPKTGVSRHVRRLQHVTNGPAMVISPTLDFSRAISSSRSSRSRSFRAVAAPASARSRHSVSLAIETFVSRATSSSGSPRNSRATIAILR